MNETGVTTSAPAGEIATLLAALGTSEGSPELLEVIGLVGPQMERHELDRGGVPWTIVVFGPHGVDLQLKEGTLVGALVYLDGADDGGRYPRPAALVEGLPLPTSRRDVLDFFADEPARASQTFDLFRFGDRYLEFDYVDDRVVSVTALLRGVAPE